MSKPCRAAKKLPDEFELIARLSKGLEVSRRTVLGVGDDCAIVSRPRGQSLFTIDSLVEGVHFDLRWGTPDNWGARADGELERYSGDGRKADGMRRQSGDSAGSLSLNSSSGCTPGSRARPVRRAIDMVGGNITRASQLAITIALVGEAGAAVMRRDAARVGDEIFVTGTLGDAAPVGVFWRANSVRAVDESSSREKIFDRSIFCASCASRCRTRLARIRPAPAAIDISDGLWQDLGHILEAQPRRRENRPTRDSRVGGLSRRDARRSLARATVAAKTTSCCSACIRNTANAGLPRCSRAEVRRIGTIVKGGGVGLIGGGAPSVVGWDQLRAQAARMNR